MVTSEGKGNAGFTKEIQKQNSRFWKYDEVMQRNSEHLSVYE